MDPEVGDPGDIRKSVDSEPTVGRMELAPVYGKEFWDRYAEVMKQSADRHEEEQRREESNFRMVAAELFAAVDEMVFVWMNRIPGMRHDKARQLFVEALVGLRKEWK